MDAREDPVPVLNLHHWTDGTPAQRAQLLDDVRVTCAEVRPESFATGVRRCTHFVARTHALAPC
jgi:hypothetical protein